MQATDRAGRCGDNPAAHIMRGHMRLQTAVAMILVCVVMGIGQAASTTSQTNSTGTFVGTTPASAELLKFFGAPPGTDAVLVEWSLSLTSSFQYTLHASYGQTQPSLPGIQRDRHEVDRKGTWTARKGTKWSPSEDVIDLGGLAFVRVGPSHLVGRPFADDWDGLLEFFPEPDRCR
jgi:hypothetical protein